MSLIYLAGPIDRATTSPIPWVEQLRKMLRDSWDQQAKGGVTPLLVYSPQAAFWGSSALADRVSAMQVMDVNQSALLRADLVMVKYEPGIETWGTAQEVLTASQVDIPILVWYAHEHADRIGALPMYLTAFMSEFPFPWGGALAASKSAVEWLLRKK